MNSKRRDELVAAALHGELPDAQELSPGRRLAAALTRMRLRGFKFEPGDREELRRLFGAPEPKETDEGRKDDAGKAPYELLAPEMLEDVAQVLAFGAGKYAPRNWEKGMRWGRVFGAAMRHLWAWWRGEDRDPETGLSHLAHAACCVMFLLAYEARGVGEDDRPVSE